MPAADETASEPPAAALQPEVESEPAAVPATPDITEAPAAESISVTEPTAIEPAEPSPEAAEAPAASPAVPPAAEPTVQTPQAPEPAPVQPEPAVQEPAKPAQSPQSKDELYAPTGTTEVEYTNVLQSLVEDISPYYICNMLQCNCQRCIADMKALALTNLPSKYVVLEKDHKAAYMSVYAARYEKLLSVQMMRACVIVNEHPHH